MPPILSSFWTSRVTAQEELQQPIPFQDTLKISDSEKCEE